MKPWAVELELVRGCNMNCAFCANRALPKAVKFMSRDTLLCVGALLAPLGRVRVELVGRGEPLLHPELPSAVAALRALCPKAQLMLMTNGKELTSHAARALFVNGLNLLVVDCYNRKTATIVGQIGKKIGLTPQLYGMSDANPWANHGPRAHQLIIVDDLAVPGKSTRRMYSRCGAVPSEIYKKYGIVPASRPLARMCVKPWRHLMIHWNGDIPLCCMDWIGTRIFGHASRIDDLSQWWGHNPELRTARRRLARADRDFIPCRKCDYLGGQRMGLLPKEDEA